MQKILCRLPNWIGDVMMCLPSLELLRQQQIEPILLGKPWIHELLAGLAFKTYTWPKQLWPAMQLLRQLEPKKILLFPNSFSSALGAKLGGKLSIGYRADGRSFLLNQAIQRPPKLIHEADIFYHLSSKLVGEHRIQPCIPKLILNPNSQSKAKHGLEAAQIPENYILLCPFAHGLNRQGQEKTWPMWDKLYHALLSQTMVICPGPNEHLQAQKRFPKAHIIPNLPLDQYAAVANSAKIVIANDSGPMHLAAAVNAPTLGIFGATDPERSAPRNAHILGNLGQWPSLDEVLEYILAQI